MLTPAAESASHAHQTASPVSPILSAMLAMLATTLPTESASPPPSLAHPDSTDTTEFATLLAQSEAALKETSVREFAQLVHGHTILAATEPAPPSIPPTTPASILAPQEPLFKMESVRSDPKAAHPVNSSTQLHPHARTVSTLALNAPLLPHTAQLALLD